MAAVVMATSNGVVPSTNVPFVSFPKEIDSLIVKLSSSTLKNVSRKEEGYENFSRIQEVLSALKEINVGIALSPNPDLLKNRAVLLEMIQRIINVAFEMNIYHSLVLIDVPDGYKTYSAKLFNNPELIQIDRLVKFRPDLPKPKIMDHKKSSEYVVVDYTTGIQELECALYDPEIETLLDPMVLSDARKAIEARQMQWADEVRILSEAQQKLVAAN